MAKYIIIFLVLPILGYVQVLVLARARERIGKVPADVRWRMTHIAIPLIGLVLVLFLATIFLLRLHA